MIILKDSIEIKTTPERVFNWLKNLDRHYNEWHPDHIKWINVTGGLNVGDVVYFEEYFHGKLHKAKSKITKVEENKRIEFVNLFPTSILAPKGSFIIEPRGRSCIFTATLSIRFGWIIPRFTKSRLDDLKKHMKEEGENLKKLLEK